MSENNFHTCFQCFPFSHPELPGTAHVAVAPQIALLIALADSGILVVVEGD